jgi:hypothetical protein
VLSGLTVNTSLRLMILIMVQAGLCFWAAGEPGEPENGDFSTIHPSGTIVFLDGVFSFELSNVQ